MYQGIYRGKVAHMADIAQVIQRASESGVESMIITGVNLESSIQALEYAKRYSLYSTAGCHPTHSNEFHEYKEGPEQYYKELQDLIRNDQLHDRRIVAIGECGLDYDRLEFCPKDIQKQYFVKQLELSKEFDLPLFLHMRNTETDFIDIIKNYGINGVVHSFDGQLDDMKALVGMGLYIGVNGCSLKTLENLNVVKEIPVDRLLIETDAPWCDIRPAHASHQYVRSQPAYQTKKKEKFEMGQMVKSRNEPCLLHQVLQVVAGIKGVNEEELSQQLYHNTINLFKIK
ncbi:TatD DNase [Terramyces sp. JEL0728]|nr:TatD DNase [Terramyces sp. JEL0728]